MARGILDPEIERLADLAPILRRRPQHRGIAALVADQLLEAIERGRADQLQHAERTLAADRHRSQRPRIASAALIEHAVEDNAAADEGADEEVDEVAIAAADAEGELGGAGRGGVVARLHRPARQLRHLAHQVEGAPDLQHVARRADLLLPVPQLEWRRDAEAGDARALRRLEVTLQFLDPLAHERKRGRRLRIAISAMPPRAHLAQQVDQHEIRAAPPDLEPDR